jgi:tetratricopeptide (TPR) repeat protein
MRANAIEAMDDVFRRALLLHPTDFMLNFDYAYMLEAAERWDEAVRYYHRALTIRPKNGGIWRCLGVALRELDDVSGSLDALDQSINYQPDHAPIWVELGLTRAQGKDLAGSIAAYRRAIILDPDLATAHCSLGRALRTGGFLSEALIELQMGHDLGIRNPRWSYPSQQWIEECRRLLDERKSRPTTPWRTPG